MRWDGKIYGKYRIEHADGTPLKGKKYFVLRLDSDDPIDAARVATAMRVYEGKPRNCDIGTADEQARKFYAFCQSHSSPIDGLCDMGCPCLGSEDRCHCLTKWMSLPYQETERNTGSAPVAAQE